MTVASPPGKPLLIYDGDCSFCRYWIRRWKQMTGEKVDYLPSQDMRVPAEFPEIPTEQFGQPVIREQTGGRSWVDRQDHEGPASRIRKRELLQFSVQEPVSEGWVPPEDGDPPRGGERRDHREWVPAQDHRRDRRRAIGSGAGRARFDVPASRADRPSLQGPG